MNIFSFIPNQRNDSMISLNNLIIKDNLIVSISKYQKDINKLFDNINDIYDFSSILEIISINKVNNKFNNSNILLYIKAYENITNSNDFNFCNCPNCKHNSMKFYKSYQRNIIFYFNEYEIVAKISLTVLECSFCKQDKKYLKQHFHTLLPDFIFPYHIYSSDIILDTLTDRFINNIKINIILKERRISHQLFYTWIKGFKRYSLSSSIILSTESKLIDIISKINNNRDLFLYQFYQQFFHPFFLFRLTCVNLCIIS